MKVCGDNVKCEENVGREIITLFPPNGGDRTL
jgi:hypothetical protein